MSGALLAGAGRIAPPGSEVLHLPPHGDIPVLWRRSPRARRISLRLDAKGGRIILTLPVRGSRSAGLKLLTDHAGWAATRLAALPPLVPLADGGSILLHGMPHCIVHRPVGGAGIGEGTITVGGDLAFLGRRVTDLLRREALRHLTASVAAVCARADLMARRVTVKDTRSRWGSCAPDGSLMFCWRLVMAPGWVQDYVVAHEVAHLRHMNHGRAFWGLVAELSDDHAAATRWLKVNGAALLRV